MRSGYPRVLLIVLNWNGARDTYKCLASLRALHYPGELKVLVIDNGSREKLSPDLGEKFPEVELIETGKNLGYAGGNNIGLRRAVEEDFTYACILNNDVTAMPGFLTALVDAAGKRDRVAAAGAKLLATGEPGMLYMTYGEITYRQSLVRLAGWRERERPVGAAGEDTREVEWVPGCCLLLSVAALRAIGFFDEEFFAYHEDVDWCTRARRQGWRILYVPAASVYHWGNSSLGGRKYVTARAYLSARNTVLFARKHATSLEKLKLAAFIVFSLPFQYLRRLPSGEGGGVTLKVRGWRDGLRGSPIPYEELGLR